MVTLPASDRHLTYGVNFVSPEMNFTHHRDKGYSPPR